MIYVVRCLGGVLEQFESDKLPSDALEEFQAIEPEAFMICKVGSKVWWDETIQRVSEVEVGSELDRRGFLEVSESEQFEDSSDVVECPF